MADDAERILNLGAGPLDVELDHRRVGAPPLVGDRGHGGEELAEVDPARLGAGEFRIEAGGVGDVRDQTVEALHIVLDDLHQPAARLVGLGQRQGLDRAAQGGQRVLQLVADIGGEALDGVEPAVERLGHVAQRARQVADFVCAAREVGNLLA